MSDSNAGQYPALVVKFVERYETDGSILCTSSPQEVARRIRGDFELPMPVTLADADRIVASMNDAKVYMQPGLEQTKHIRGTWFALPGIKMILIEPERPTPSRIKTLIHEVGEQMLEISHSRHQRVPMRRDRERERWADKLAAFVKMPADKFRRVFQQQQLDIEVIAEKMEDTLAGVVRHIRDLEMKQRPFYWCRFDIERRPQKYCPDLLDVVEASGGGYCICVVDAVPSNVIHNGRQGGGLPTHNLPSFDHYRVLSPVMNDYIQSRKPVFFSVLQGGHSDIVKYRDLFGENEICVLLIPYGRGRTKGFCLLAVHPRDKYLLASVLNRHTPDERGELDWLFSWAFVTRKRPTYPVLQHELPGIGDNQTLPLSFKQEAYLWKSE